MKWKMSAVVIATSVFAVFMPIRSTAQGPAHGQLRYKVQDLGALGGTYSSAFGINNLGWITGAANLAGDQTEHPVLWRNGSIIDLGTFGGENGSAGFPLKNNLGLVPAFAQTSETDPLGENWNFTCSLSGNLCEGTNLIQHGFLSIFGLKITMPTLGGNNGAAWGANDWGQVVGLAETDTVDPNCVAPQVLDYEAVLWSPINNRIQMLPPYPGDTVGAAVGINDRGQAVGATGSCAPVSPAIGAHAVLWENGKVKISAIWGRVQQCRLCHQQPRAGCRDFRPGRRYDCACLLLAERHAHRSGHAAG